MNDFDDEIPRSRMYTGYAWIVALILFGAAAACIVGIAAIAWGQR